MRTVITGGGFLVVTALCVLIHCSIISNPNLNHTAQVVSGV